MLTEAELKKLLTDLESETVERSRAFDKAEKMGQAISAFANDLPGRKQPGYLLLGVENDGQISGKRISDEQLTSLGGLKTEGALLPPPSMAIEIFNTLQRLKAFFVDFSIFHAKSVQQWRRVFN